MQCGDDKRFFKDQKVEYYGYIAKIVDYRHRRFFEVFSSVTFFDRLPVEITDEQNLKKTSRDDTKLFRFLKPFIRVFGQQKSSMVLFILFFLTKKSSYNIIKYFGKQFSIKTSLGLT